jgi:hypothetical protein
VSSLPDESIEQRDLPPKMVSYVSSASLIECESTTKFTIFSTSLIMSGVLGKVRWAILLVPLRELIAGETYTR